MPGGIASGSAGSSFAYATPVGSSSGACTNFPGCVPAPQVKWAQPAPANAAVAGPASCGTHSARPGCLLGHPDSTPKQPVVQGPWALAPTTLASTSLVTQTDFTGACCMRDCPLLLPLRL